MKRRILRLSLWAAGLGVAGLLVAVSGLIPIRASAGHWPPTRWFLEFSRTRSIQTHSSGIRVPDLSDPAWQIAGAGAYHANCFACHGSVSLPQPPVFTHMEPSPTFLPTAVGQWKARELFYITKHGFKFTGMPSWPDLHRDDEVWAVVAFLQSMPRMDAGTYEQLTHGQTQANVCARCHEREGTDAFPRLAGQSVDYLEDALEAYATGQRYSGVMGPIATMLTAEKRREFAEYYAALKPPSPAPSISEAILRGKEIAMEGIPDRKVPSCMDCHNPEGSKRKDTYPVLEGQHARYLKLQLHLFQQDRRGGSRSAHLMQHAVRGLSTRDIEDVALYYQSLAPYPSINPEPPG